MASAASVGNMTSLTPASRNRVGRPLRWLKPARASINCSVCAAALPARNCSPNTSGASSAYSGAAAGALNASTCGSTRALDSP